MIIQFNCQHDYIKKHLGTSEGFAREDNGRENTLPTCGQLHYHPESWTEYQGRGENYLQAYIPLC